MHLAIYKAQKRTFHSSGGRKGQEQTPIGSLSGEDPIAHSKPVPGMLLSLQLEYGSSIDVNGILFSGPQ